MHANEVLTLRVDDAMIETCEATLGVDYCWSIRVEADIGRSDSEMGSGVGRVFQESQEWKSSAISQVWEHTLTNTCSKKTESSATQAFRHC